MSCKSGVGPLKTSSGDVVTDGPQKAEMPNGYFASIFTVDDSNLPPFERRVKNNVCMSQVEFISGDIEKVIANLRNTKTVDPHGVNNIFIKRLRFALARPLSIIYHYIFSTGNIPDSWRTAKCHSCSYERCFLTGYELQADFSYVIIL